MGLAGVKKSTKIGIDPRNTKWINNENGVGHKLLTAQGWVPGQGLGDSMLGRTVNIKTAYKDDTAGIGCTPKHAQEWSGLGAFNDIFTRINSTDVFVDNTDSGLKNKDRVIFMETKEKRVGLDVRFVKGETFTSELSRIKFLESLGIGLGTQDEDSEAKAQRKARRAAKAARRLERAAKRAKKSSKKSPRKTRKDVQGDRPESSASASSADDEIGDLTGKISAPVAVVIPPRIAHGRFASRAKYQRAKLGSRMDEKQLAEILGVKA